MTSPENNNEGTDKADRVAAAADALYNGDFEEVLTDQGYEDFHDALSAIGHCQASRGGELLIQLYFADPRENTSADDENLSWLGIHYDFTLEGLDMDLDPIGISLPAPGAPDPLLDPEFSNCPHIVIKHTEVVWEKL